jgi:hypothetical protein
MQKIAAKLKTPGTGGVQKYCKRTSKKQLVVHRDHAAYAAMD